MNFSPRTVLYLKSWVFLKYSIIGSSYQILRCAMLYPWPGVRKSVFFIICSVAKTYSFIYSNKHLKQQREKKKARKKPTFNATKYVQNVIKLKQNFLNNLFQYFSNIFYLSLEYCQFYLRMFPKHLKTDSFLLMYCIFFER